MKKLIAILSSRNWGIIRYNSIWQNLAALFYIALVEERFSLVFIAEAFLFLLFSTVMTGFGYLVNDLADKDLDRKQAKPNAFQNMGRAQAGLVVVSIFALGALVAFTFLTRPGFLTLWVVWLAAAVFYSLPPLRLKERGLPGLVVTIAAQQPLPVAMLFTIFGNLYSLGAVVFMLFATVRGISSDISHQMRDREKDAASGSHTYAVRQGNALVRRVYASALEVERLLLGAVMAVLLLNLPVVTLPWVGRDLSPAWPLVLFYLPLFVLTAGSSIRAARRGLLELNDPYNEARQAAMHDPLHVIHHPLPSVIAPLYLAGLMTLHYWPNLIFLLVLFLLYGLYSPRRWMEAWPLRPLLARLKSFPTGRAT